jgi:putative flippase GtrA
VASFARFVAGGVVTYPTALVVMAFWIHGLRLPMLVAYALTHVVVLAVGFVLNRRWIFRATHVDAAAQGASFVAASLAFRAVDWCLYSVLMLLLAPPWALAVLLANLIVVPVKYLFFRHRVFPAASSWPERAT